LHFTRDKNLYLIEPTQGDLRKLLLEIKSELEKMKKSLESQQQQQQQQQQPNDNSRRNITHM